jgi:alpha-tubulin suppressor-like RCC1 family protein
VLLRCLQVSSISCRGAHVVAVTSTGSVWSWGRNSEGQLGLGHRQTCTTPQHVEALATVTIKQACAGRLHSMFLTDQGLLWTVGCGEDGQLGLGESCLTLVLPEQLPGHWFGENPVEVMEAGSRHCLCATNVGQVYAWGHGEHGQLGAGHTDSVASPMPLLGLLPRNGRYGPPRLWVGYRHCMALNGASTP